MSLLLLLGGSGSPAAKGSFRYPLALGVLHRLGGYAASGTFQPAWAVYDEPAWIVSTMRKNVASQVVTCNLVSKTDGSAVTSGTTDVYVTGNAGTQAAGSGTVTHEGNGEWSYVPTQAETNYNHVAYTFVNSSAINRTVEREPVSFDPTDAVRIGLAALPNAAADAAGGLPISDAGGLDLDNRMPSATSTTNMNVVFTTDFPTNYSTANDQWNVSASAVASVTGAVGSVTGNVGGNVTGSVGSVVGDVGGNVVGSVASVTAGVTLADGAHGGASATLTLEHMRIESSNGDGGLYIQNTVGPGIGILAGADDAIHAASSTDMGLNLTGGLEIGGLVDISGSITAATNNIPWNAAYDAEVQSEVQDAIEANNLDHLVGTATGIPSIPAGTFLDQIMDDGTAVFDRTTDSLQAIRDNTGTAGAGLTSVAPASTALSTAQWTNTLATNLGTLASHDPGETIMGATDAITVTTNNDKTGYKLASDGLDSVTASTPTTVATTFPAKMMQLWARFFGRTTRDSDEIKTYRSDGTTVATTQTYTASGSDEDVGAAS